MGKELSKNKHEEISIHIAAKKNITFTRDFSISTNRGMYVRICGGDYSYHAIGFDMKPLKSFQIDWFNTTKSTCKIARFRGFYHVTFSLKGNTKFI
jgi:hypothetical protein